MRSPGSVLLRVFFVGWFFVVVDFVFFCSSVLAWTAIEEGMRVKSLVRCVPVLGENRTNIQDVPART